MELLLIILRNYWNLELSAAKEGSNRAYKWVNMKQFKITNDLFKLRIKRVRFRNRTIIIN